MESDKRRMSYLNWFFNRPRTSGFLAFLMVFAMSLYILYQRHRLNSDNYNREMHNLLEVAYSNVDQALKNASNNALTLALTLNDDGIPENFETVGRQLLQSNKGIDAVQLAPNGRIEYMYPLEGNEVAIGYDVMNDPRHRPDLLKTIALNRMYFAGPFELKQGGIAVVGRLPVYIHNRFWGFSVVIIRLNTLLHDTGINSIDQSRYQFQLSLWDREKNKEVFFTPPKESYADKLIVSKSIPETGWKLHIISNDTRSDILIPLIPLFLFGLIFSLLFGYVITLLLKKPQQLHRQVRRQAEKILESQTKFRSMFEQAAIGIANIDTHTGKFLEINDAYANMLGYSTAEMLGKTFMDITHPADVGPDLVLIDQLKEGKIREFTLEKRVITKEGSPRWISVTVSPLWAVNEQPTSHIAIVQDITLEKAAKDEIRLNEARFKSLFEDSPVALWEEDFSEVKSYLQTLDLDLNHRQAIDYFSSHPEVVKKCMEAVKILNVNNECLALHAPKTREDLMKGLSALLDEYTSEVFILQLAAIVTGQSKFVTETRVAMESGEVRDISLGWSVMRGHEDLLDRVIISTEDITAQKASQQTILASRKRLENLINTIEGIVWECDADTLVQHFISQKTEGILGHTAEEWLADEYFWRKHLHPDDAQHAIGRFLEIAKAKSEGVIEYRMMAKDGSIVWIRDIMSTVAENDHYTIRGIMIDITASKEAEQAMNESLELVNEHKKRLMNFSYIVSHNLRSHAANIQSIAQFLDMTENNEEQQEMIDMLKTVSASLNDTMYNLNDLVNVQTNDNLTIETLNLRDYILNAMELLGGQINERNANIHIDVPDDVQVEYNAAYLESILHNLISNALRYSSPDRTPEIHLRWNEQGERSLTVSDNGIGIDMARHGDKLFGMYKTFNGNADARGIGLFMTKSQIEMMGGRITAKSEVGKGTSFTITFR